MHWYLDISCKTSVKYVGWKVKSIEFSTEDGIALAGDYKFDLTTGQFAIADGSSKIELRVDNTPALVANGVFPRIYVYESCGLVSETM